MPRLLLWLSQLTFLIYSLQMYLFTSHKFAPKCSVWLISEIFKGTRFDFMNILGYEGFQSGSVASANDTVDIESDRPEASAPLLARLRFATSYIYLPRLQPVTEELGGNELHG